MKHGHCPARHPSPTFIVWNGIIARCTNPRARSYPRYGGAGVALSARWQGEHGFENFLADMGERPAGTSIDRKKNDQGYEPGNCRWIPTAEQARNRRSVHLRAEDIPTVMARVRDGEPISAIARSYGCNSSTIHDVLAGRSWKAVSGIVDRHANGST